MKRALVILCIIAAAPALNVVAQALDTQILSSSIKTLKVSPLNNIYFPPIYVMGQPDNPLVFSFDDLSEDRKYLRYSVVHCNSNWQPSQLQESEYTTSFNYADIEDFEYSSNTFVHYVHYRFSLPNNDIDFQCSGNYIVQVYEQDSPDEILLQAEFMVCENTVMVTPTVTSRTDIDYNERHQQLSVTVTDNHHVINDPFNDITLIASQNLRTDNEVTLKRPMMVSGNKYIYQNMKELIFPAANEFRRIETVSINSLSMGVEQMEYFHPYYHATLRTDFPRASSPYYYDSTQHGHFTIRNQDSEHSDVESDYVVTHFCLQTDEPITNGQIYVDGEFTAHQFNTSNLMRYDASTGSYTCEMLLKQGAYNYQYLWMPQGSTVAQTSLIEGDKYQTVNKYLVKVYQRKPSDRYDRFIGFGIVFSGK
ncbi:MAG: DUF5103 domain-containing protein [Muribaculaceae bacterium]